MKLFVFAAAWSVTGCALDSSNPESSVEQPIVTRSVTSSDGYITLTMSSTNQQDATGVTSTYTWTAHNTWTGSITGVTLGSHWGDYTGVQKGPAAITDSDVVAPAAVDEQLAGSASTGSPPVGANTLTITAASK